MANMGLPKTAQRRRWAQILDRVQDVADATDTNLSFDRDRFMKIDPLGAAGMTARIGNQVKRIARSLGADLPYPRAPFENLEKAGGTVDALEDASGIELDSSTMAAGNRKQVELESALEQEYALAKLKAEHDRRMAELQAGTISAESMQVTSTMVLDALAQDRTIWSGHAGSTYQQRRAAVGLALNEKLSTVISNESAVPPAGEIRVESAATVKGQINSVKSIDPDGLYLASCMITGLSAGEYVRIYLDALVNGAATWDDTLTTTLSSIADGQDIAFGVAGDDGFLHFSLGYTDGNFAIAVDATGAQVHYSVFPSQEAAIAKGVDHFGYQLVPPTDLAKPSREPKSNSILRRKTGFWRPSKRSRK